MPEVSEGACALDLIKEILTRNQLDDPDGRPLHAYATTQDELERLQKLLRLRIECEHRFPETAQSFVLWASEHIRTKYPGGKLEWEFVVSGLEIHPPDRNFLRWLTETGLAAWRRTIHRSPSRHRKFLYSLLAEGGLPDLALNESGTYRNVLVHLVQELEAEGGLFCQIAPIAAQRRSRYLPQVFQNEEQVQLLADLATGLFELRESLPNNPPPKSAEAWLSEHMPGWENKLPIRLSPQALESLVRPVLAAERKARTNSTLPVRRELRRAIDGGWIGVAVISDNAHIPSDMIEGEKGERIRLLTETGSIFLAQFESNAWMLSHVSGSATVRFAPDESVALAAFKDGQLKGDVILDLGLPSPEESPSLWKPANSLDVEPEVLIPLSNRGITKEASLWLLTHHEAKINIGDGVEIGPSERGPNGVLWPLSGKGTIKVDGHSLAIHTNADEDASDSRMIPIGDLLPTFKCNNGAPVFVGVPRFFGSLNDGPLKLIQNLELRGLSRTVGGHIAEWSDREGPIARTKIIFFPESSDLRLQEIAPGRARLTAKGLQDGWHLTLIAGEDSESALITQSGKTEIELQTNHPPGLVELRITQPQTGASIKLSAMWPARMPLIVSQHGERLEFHREISLSNLNLWRGILPGRCYIVLSNPVNNVEFPFHSSGNIRLANYTALIQQFLALLGADSRIGADGRVNLRLEGAGTQTPRLQIGRYDWQSKEDGDQTLLPAGTTQLTALNLHEPSQVKQIYAEERVELAEALGDSDSIWMIHGQHRDQGIMRPYVWTAQDNTEKMTREDRILAYAKQWEAVLEKEASIGKEPGDEEPIDESSKWTAIWSLIRAARNLGNAGVLDQVQALQHVHAAAIFLLFSVQKSDRAAVLELEIEAPIWWPIISYRDWELGIRAASSRLETLLENAGIDNTKEEAKKAMQQAAGQVALLRPELLAHIGYGMAKLGWGPIATDYQRGQIPLASNADIETLAQGALQRLAAQGIEHLPVAADALTAETLSPPVEGHFATLFHAPLVAAEIAAGKRAPLSIAQTLQLIALRDADPTWFDNALAAVMTKIIFKQ